MKKVIGIVIFSVVIVLSLVASIYLPNKDKINSETEDKSVTYNIIKENEKYGVKNQEDKVIIEADYEKIIIPNEHRDVFFCINGDNTVVLNNTGKKIFTEYEKVEPIKLQNIIEETYEKNALIYIKNGKYGLISISGKGILEAKYDSIYSLGNKENEVIVNDNNKYKIYDVKGNQLIKDEFNAIESDGFYDEQNGYKNSGYIVCKITEDGYRYGYYDCEYNKVLDIEYNQISRIADISNKNGIYLIVAKNGQYGVYVDNAKIINTQYQSINYDNNLKIFIVERTGKYGIFNEKGLEILKPEYDSIEVRGIYIYIKKGEEQSVIDTEAKKVDIPYDTTIEKTDNSNYFIKIEGNMYGIVDKNMNSLIDCKYDLIQIIKNTEILQAVNFETNVTDIYNKNLEKVLEMNNANIEIDGEIIKVYNETNEYTLDKDGNIQNK